MNYFPETYYWIDSKFPVQEAISIIIKTIAQWCSYYEVNILSPKKGVKIKNRYGNLPKNNQEKEKLIENILNWVADSSKDDWYRLELSNQKNNNKLIRPKFYKYEGLYCCWGLELTDDEFIELKDKLITNNLPIDLFYPQDKQIVVIPKYYEKWSKLRRILFGGTHAFSPKTWESMKKYGKDKKYIIQKPE